MINGYIDLFNQGIAHSVEVWEGDEMVGGLYGVSIGKIFFGESMFSLKPNASKFGLITLVNALKEKGYWLIDCQQETDHLKRLGAEVMPRLDFLELLHKNKKNDDNFGSWAKT